MPNLLTIVNTSPLLYLHQIGYLDILEKMYQTIYVPQAVLDELEVGKMQGINIPELENISWIKIKTIPSIASFPTITDLGKGESEVIALGLENPQSLLIIDDQLARQIAQLYQLKYTGTLGVLIKAKKLGYINSIAPIIKQLQSKGMWLTDKIITEVLKLANES